jgi:hypothetical protein
MPDAKYEALCISYNFGFITGKYRKLFMIFKITSPGSYHGKEIMKIYNMPTNKPISMASNYYKDWVLVNGNHKPARIDRLSPKIFRNKILIIKTRTSRPRHNNKQEMPEDFWYSIVDYISEVATGNRL